MTETWIYHERQEALLCGQHALNNLLQTQAFSPLSLAEIAHQLDQMELNFMSESNKNGVESKDFIKRLAEGSGNVDASGNFSIEVLKSALLSRFNLTLVNTLQESIRDMEITNFDGFICNKLSHWFAIRKINGIFWNLNSTKDRPEQISHFRLAAEIEALRNAGYSVFCVAEMGDMPAECKDEKELPSRGEQKFWWKERDLVSGTGNRGYSNPWNNVGSGMRLDGRSTSTAGNGNGQDISAINVEGLTEEEMMQMALAFSMQQNDDVHPPQYSSSTLNLDSVKLMPEPSQGAGGVVRLQFRLPDGKRLTRRFLGSESVKVLAAFVHEQCPQSGSKTLELRAGFPPKDIAPLYNETIVSAKLSGESIQCRFC
jgi:ataxin-3